MVEVKANAEFTEDMADTLRTYFQDYAIDGVVNIEVTDHGLWLVNPDGQSRQFLGLARLPVHRKSDRASADSIVRSQKKLN